MGLETAAAIGLGISALGSGYQIFQGARAKSDASSAAAQAAQQYASIQEGNKFNELQVPTLGLELAQQNLQARQASNIQALQEGGAATVLGGLTAANQQAQAQDLQLAAQAQEAQYARDMAQAQNAQQLEANRVNREAGLAQSRLQGAQVAAAEGAGAIAAGIGGLAEAGVSTATLSAYKDIYGNKGTGTLGNTEFGQAASAYSKDLNNNPLGFTSQNTLTSGYYSNPEMKAFKTNQVAAMPAPMGVLALQPVPNWTQQPAPFSWASLGFKR
jgi:hypothetical protein